jgi:trk system potassium uptake protein TrkH
MRYTAYMRSRYAAILHILGRSLVVVGAVIVVPIVVVPFGPEGLASLPPYLLTGIGVSVFGALLTRFPMQEGEPFTFQEGTVVVVLIWLVTMVASVIPFLMLLELTFSQALFESVSGWTSTGLTVVDVANAPQSILLFRSLTQYAGAAGVVIIVMSSLAGPSGIGLTAAEGRGMQLVPNVQKSAQVVLRLYLAYAAVGIAALALAGMPFFEAIIHALSAVATGGFSTHAESIGFYDSVVIEIIVMVLMLIGSVSFVTAYAFFKGDENVPKNSELRFSVVITLLLVAVLFVGATQPIAPDVGTALRMAAFEGVSAITTAGFTISDYSGWVPFGWLVLIVAMIVGGGTESTAGAIKHLRVLVLLRTVVWEVRRAFLPEKAVNQPSYMTIDGEEYITDKQVRQIALFVVSYGVFLVLGTLAFTAYGYPLNESLFEFTSAIGTTGLSSGITGPELPTGLLWVAMAGMFLGRLEILAILIGLGKIVTDAPVVVLGGDEQRAED